MLAGEDVGIREEVDGRWLVTFCDLDLGHFASKKFVGIDHSVPRGVP